MDLRQLEAEPTAEEREAIDARLGDDPERAGTHFAAGFRRGRRHLLLPALQAAQAAGDSPDRQERIRGVRPVRLAAHE